MPSVLFYKEFVEFRQLLTPDQLLTGFAFQKTLPGPLFSFSSYVGGLAMQKEGFGLSGVILEASSELSVYFYLAPF